MDLIDFTEGLKILSSCYQRDINNDDFTIWYELLKNIDQKYFIEAIKELCIEKSYMPSVHDILDKSKKIKSRNDLLILQKMKERGYFKEGIKPLDAEHESLNYEKAIRWAEKGILPGFLKDDIKKYNGIKLIKE